MNPVVQGNRQAYPSLEEASAKEQELQTARVVEYLNTCCERIATKHDLDLSSAYTKMVEDRKITVLPLPPYAILKVLFYSCIFPGDTLIPDYIFQYMKERASLKRCLLDFGKFLARLSFIDDLENYAEKWLGDQDRVDLAKIVAKTGLASNSIQETAAVIRGLLRLNLQEDRNPARYLEEFGLLLSNDDLRAAKIPLDHHLTPKLLKQAAEAGNLEASRALVRLQHPQELGDNSILGEVKAILYSLFRGETEAEANRRHQLLLLGDVLEWRKTLFEANKEIALQALSRSPNVYMLINSSLKQDQDILTCFVDTVMEKGCIGYWSRLPSALKTVDKALEILSKTGTYYSDDDVTVSWQSLPLELQNNLKEDPRFHQLIEEKIRAGGYKYHFLLQDEKLKDRDLILTGVKANPKLYVKLAPDNTCKADPEIIAAYLKKNPWQTERILIELHNPVWMIAAIRFAEFVLKEDKYITLSQDVDDDTKRYFNIASKLPMELQMVLAARTAGSEQNVIPPHDVEWALRFVLMLREHEK